VDARGNVYVAGTLSHNVLRVAPDGSVSQILDANGDGRGARLAQPTDVAVDAAGNVFVAGSVSDNVFRVSAPPP
jgi:hypothetical protein